MKTFPAFHALTARKVVIAGAGEAASSKARLAGAAGADLLFIASGLDGALVAEWGERAEFDARAPSSELFLGAALAFIAPRDRAEGELLASFARQAGVPVNVVDHRDLCDFITPSIVDRGDVVVAVSTNGAAPALGRRIREKIERLLPANLGALAAAARSMRGAVSARISKDRRRAFWENFFDGPIAAQIREGDIAGARKALINEVGRPLSEEKPGVVHLVGAGPGDPDLLTLKALRLIQSADVILYDRLVSDGVLNLARRDAARFYVGKAKSAHAVPQEEIERRLIAFAREGKTVVRLKGGDPFIFGRGGEEVDALRAAGIPVFITPGITAAIGCAASAALPLTHRDFSQAVTFVTGHARDGGEPSIDWKALAALGHTVVVYMGVGEADTIARRLIENGRSGATPVAVIEKGATAAEKVLKGTLAELGAIIRVGRVAGPAILVIGEVAAKADGLLLEEFAAMEREAA